MNVIEKLEKSIEHYTKMRDSHIENIELCKAEIERVEKSRLADGPQVFLLSECYGNNGKSVVDIYADYDKAHEAKKYLESTNDEYDVSYEVIQMPVK